MNRGPQALAAATRTVTATRVARPMAALATLATPPARPRWAASPTVAKPTWRFVSTTAPSGAVAHAPGSGFQLVTPKSTSLIDLAALRPALEAKDWARALDLAERYSEVVPGEELAAALCALDHVPPHTQTTGEEWTDAVDSIFDAVAKLPAQELAVFAHRYPDAIGSLWRAAAAGGVDFSLIAVKDAAALFTATGNRVKNAVAIARVWFRAHSSEEFVFNVADALENLASTPGISPLDAVRVRVIRAAKAKDFVLVESLVAAAVKDDALAHAWVDSEVNYFHLHLYAHVKGDVAAMTLIKQMLESSPTALSMECVSAVFAHVMHKYREWPRDRDLVLLATAAEEVAALAAKNGTPVHARALERLANWWVYTPFPEKAVELLGPIGEKVRALGSDTLSPAVFCTLADAYGQAKDGEVEQLMNLHRHLRLMGRPELMDMWYFEELILGVLRLGCKGKGSAEAQRTLDLALALLQEMSSRGHYAETELRESFYVYGNEHGYTGLIESMDHVQGYALAAAARAATTTRVARSVAALATMAMLPACPRRPASPTIAKPTWRAASATTPSRAVADGPETDFQLVAPKSTDFIDLLALRAALEAKDWARASDLTKRSSGVLAGEEIAVVSGKELAVVSGKELSVVSGKELSVALRALDHIPPYTQTTGEAWSNFVDSVFKAVAKLPAKELAVFAHRYPDAIGSLWRAAAAMDMDMEAGSINADHTAALAAATGDHVKNAVAIARVLFRAYFYTREDLDALESLAGAPGIAPLDAVRVRVIRAAKDEDFALLESLVAAAVKDGILAHAWANSEVNYFYLLSYADVKGNVAAMTLIKQKLESSPTALDMHCISAVFSHVMNKYWEWSCDLMSLTTVAEQVVALAAKNGTPVHARGLERLAHCWVFTPFPMKAIEILDPIGEKLVKGGVLASEWADPEVTYWRLRLLADRRGNAVAKAKLVEPFDCCQPALNEQVFSAVLAHMLWKDPAPIPQWLRMIPLAFTGILELAKMRCIKIHPRVRERLAQRWCTV
ncbi:hypothetical protein H9P43_002227 [Blastocladiella emersonii ATCC 22665]|nr:hypothetical protein H9P43_002227 [Blastocladiella emersonii ATCC 22665]